MPYDKIPHLERERGICAVVLALAGNAFYGMAGRLILSGAAFGAAAWNVMYFVGAAKGRRHRCDLIGNFVYRQ